MKTTLIFLVFVASMAQAQFVHKANSRIDTLASSTSWKPCYMAPIGKDFNLAVMATTHTADLRICFRWADTSAVAINRYSGFFIPFKTGITSTLNIPNVLSTDDTIWIKGAANDIIYMLKY